MHHHQNQRNSSKILKVIRFFNRVRMLRDAENRLDSSTLTRVIIIQKKMNLTVAMKVKAPRKVHKARKIKTNKLMNRVISLKKMAQSLKLKNNSSLLSKLTRSWKQRKKSLQLMVVL